MTRVNRSSFYYCKEKLTNNTCEPKQYERTFSLLYHVVNYQKKAPLHNEVEFKVITTISDFPYNSFKKLTPQKIKHLFTSSTQQAAQC